MMLLAVVATLAAGLFAGAALYITVAEHPARLSTGPRAALTQWRPAYRRGAALQAPLAVVGTLAALAVWWLAGRASWLAGAVLLGSVVPFTLLVVARINTELQGDGLDPDSARTGELLVRWGRLHGVRTVLSLAAFAVFLASLVLAAD